MKDSSYIGSAPPQSYTCVPRRDRILAPAPYPKFRGNERTGYSTGSHTPALCQLGPWGVYYRKPRCPCNGPFGYAHYSKLPAEPPVAREPPEVRHFATGQYGIRHGRENPTALLSALDFSREKKNTSLVSSVLDRCVSRRYPCIMDRVMEPQFDSPHPTVDGQWRPVVPVEFSGSRWRGSIGRKQNMPIVSRVHAESQSIISRRTIPS